MDTSFESTMILVKQIHVGEVLVNLTRQEWCIITWDQTIYV